MGLKTEILPAFYQDSVVLMRISAQVRARPSVREVALFMGTPANHALLQQAGLATPEGAGAGPNDLIMTVSAESEAAAAESIAAVKALLAETNRSQEATAQYRPRTLDAALQAMPEANLAVISIPGPYVRAEAMAALKRNLHVFIFSDNVPLDDEVALKQEALRRGRLCMGPDHGTAYLGGVGLGFANVVSAGARGLRGRVGHRAAGDRLQARRAGRGRLARDRRRRPRPVGSRRRHDDAVRARRARRGRGHRGDRAGLEAAASGRARAPRGEARLDREARRSSAASERRRAVPAGRSGSIRCSDAADAVVAHLHGARQEEGLLSDATLVEKQLAGLGATAAFEHRHILGLYTGGTLAYETAHVLRGVFGEGHGHRILDLGDDEYTVGRPHPMIDPRTRGEMIVQAAADPQVGVLLVDLVLGHGAHENPALPLAEAVTEARRVARAAGRELAVLACVIGTAQDPQGLAAQTELLRKAGIATLATNADAARCAAMLVRPQLRPDWLRKVA